MKSKYIEALHRVNVIVRDEFKDPLLDRYIVLSKVLKKLIFELYDLENDILYWQDKEPNKCLYEGLLDNEQEEYTIKEYEVNILIIMFDRFMSSDEIKEYFTEEEWELIRSVQRIL
jgi:hypothetical protein